MKKFLTLTIITIIALIGLSVSVNAADMTATEFLKDLEDGKMSADVKLTEKVVVEKDTILDLNGKTLTLGSYSIDIVNGTLTVKNGKIVADVDALRVLSTGSAILNIEEDAEVTAGDCAVIIKFPGAVLNTAGKLTSTGGGYAAIQGNGSDSNGGIKVNITGGIITSNAEGVYFPNTAELNISGGTITGTTAVYHKSGKLNISGGTLKATGAKAEYVHNNNGCDATGDALVIEASDYPGGVPVVSITGGTFISKNNKAIGYYSQDEAKYKLANEKFITGGRFYQDESEDVSKYVPAGYVTDLIAADLGLYEVKLNRPYVTGGYLEGDSDKGEMIAGTDLEQELEKVFEQEKDNNKTLKEALDAGKEVRINIQLKRLEEAKIKAEEIKALKEASKDGKFVKFYDITLEMIANGTEDLGTIPETSNKLTFRVLIPEELVKDGRTFFMYRYHDGKVEKLTGELDEENYFTFESDKFSTYALAYEDKADEPTTGGQGTAEKEPEKDETPKTGSVDVVVMASVMVAVISVAGIVTVKKYTR